MQDPPFFQLCAADATVISLLGNPPRIYEFGRAIGSDGKPPPKPYATWQIISGSPENYLAGRPDADSLTIQVNVYGTDSANVKQVRNAISYAVELDSNVVGWLGNFRDPMTNDYGTRIQIDFITQR